jgi:hypothetical protein
MEPGSDVVWVDLETATDVLEREGPLGIATRYPAIDFIEHAPLLRARGLESSLERYESFLEDG